MKQAQPDVEFVTEQAPPLGKIDAGAVAQAIADAKPDAIFNVAVRRRPRQVRARGQYARPVQGPRRRQPAVRRAGISRSAARTRRRTAGSSPAIRGTRSTRRSTSAFVDAYQKSYNDYPRLGSVVGYVTMKSLAAGIAKAGSTDTEKLVAAFEGLKVDSPFGAVNYRAIDHQATMGAFVGKLALKDGKGTMATSNTSTAPRSCRPTTR